MDYNYVVTQMRTTEATGQVYLKGELFRSKIYITRIIERHPELENQMNACVVTSIDWKMIHVLNIAFKQAADFLVIFNSLVRHNSGNFDGARVWNFHNQKHTSFWARPHQTMIISRCKSSFMIRIHPSVHGRLEVLDDTSIEREIHKSKDNNHVVIL